MKGSAVREACASACLARDLSGHTVCGNGDEVRLLRRAFLIAFLLVGSALLTVSIGAGERSRPIRIGALTASWGPTPTIVGLRDGLQELGYRENEDFVLGVRFTQGDLTALPAAARKLVQYGVLLFDIPGSILEIAARQALPTMFRQAFWVERGALASYGADYYASGRQAARLVDKVLKGENPGGIPVEVNPKIDFTINLKTAKTLGPTIAPEVLYQADRLVR